MDWTEIVIEEYKSLRTECIESIKSQQTALNFGIIISGGLVIAGFNVWEKAILPDLIFLIFVPILCYLVLIIWIGEVKRMARAGIYIKKLEKKISKEYPQQKSPLNFENWVRGENKSRQSKQLKWNYIAVISLFLFISVSSILIGDYKIWDKIELKYLIGINILELAALATTSIYIYLISRTLNK